VFSEPVVHCFGCSIGSPNGLVPILSMYTCCVNYGNLLLSYTSWSVHLIISMQPSRVGVACTPSGVCGKTIAASSCLHGDHAMGCFPFLFIGSLKVLASGSLSSPPDFGFPVMSSICTSSFYTDPTIGCGLNPSDFVLSLSPPFVLCVISALVGCCGFPMATGS
jgi:hypothetical protein